VLKKEAQMRRLVALVVALAAVLAPATAFAQEPDEIDDFLLRVAGDVSVAPGETLGVLIVIDGDAIVEGTITDALVVINGDAIVSGTIQGDLTVISGNIDLRPGSRVESINSIQSEITRADGATVAGEINEREDFAFPAGGILALFSLLFWAAVTVSLIFAGLVFAAIGGRQLNTAALLLTAGVTTFVAVLFTWIALPVVAVLLLITIIALPLGIGLLLFVLPALWLLGYIVAGSRLGYFLLSRVNRPSGEHPYLATALGLLVLQLVVLIPIIGGLTAGLAGMWGAGALMRTAFEAARGGGSAPSGGAEAEPVSSVT
jgi:hypothetical protein